MVETGRQVMTRRDLVLAAGRLGGVAAAFGVLDALGLATRHAAAQTTGWTPPSSGDFAAPNGQRVVILGAGVTGLTVAYELAKAGYECEVLEARQRPGGRCWTVRNGDVETEIGGSPQTVPFDADQYFNPGPARIPQHHLTIDYCRELGVPLEVFTNVNEDAYYYREGVGPLSGVKVRKREAKADVRGYTQELLAKSAAAGNLDALLTADDRERLIAWARNYGGLDSANTYIPSSRRGYTTLPSTEPGVVGPARDFGELLESGWGLNISSEFSFDQAMLMFQPVGGMDRIAYALAAAVPGRITYGAEVTQIRQTARGVQVVYAAGGRPQRPVAADYCVCTIPLPVLAPIAQRSSFTAERRAAIAAVPYADTSKVALQFGRRFWEDDEKVLGGITQTNLDVSTIWYPSEGYLVKPKGIVVGAYNFGGNAVSYGNSSPAERIERALAQGEKVHPQYRAEYESGWTVAWQKVRYNQGGWASWSGNARATTYPLLLEPDGRIYIAGEHMSYIGSWMAGGFESARRVVSEIHARAVATAPAAA